MKVGDKVRFLNDVGGGIVVKVLPKNQVVVRDNNDFEYPMQQSALVVVEEVARPMETKSAAPPQIDVAPKAARPQKPAANKKPTSKSNNPTDVIFLFTRLSTDRFDGFETYLVNDSDYSLFYHLVLNGENGLEQIDADKLGPNTKICVSRLSRRQINNSKELIIRMLPYGHACNVLHDMVERRMKIVPLKFFQEHNFVDNDFVDAPAYMFRLLREEPAVPASACEPAFADKEAPEEDKSARYKPRRQAPVIEVDLHINELVDSVIGMTNADILHKQLEVFHQTMTDALLQRADKVIFIHGIGNGTLKAAIRESLEKQYKLNYEDASYREYGFGATSVKL